MSGKRANVEEFLFFFWVHFWGTVRIYVRYQLRSIAPASFGLWGHFPLTHGVSMDGHRYSDLCFSLEFLSCLFDVYG